MDTLPCVVTTPLLYFRNEFSQCENTENHDEVFNTIIVVKLQRILSTRKGVLLYHIQKHSFRNIFQFCLRQK